MNTENNENILVVNAEILQKKVRKCERCGDPIIGRNRKADYCGDSCRVSAYKVRKKMRELDQVIPVKVEILQEPEAPPAILNALFYQSEQLEVACNEDCNNQDAIIEEKLGAVNQSDNATKDTIAKEKPEVSSQSNNTAEVVLTEEELRHLNQMLEMTASLESITKQYRREGKMEVPLNIIHALISPKLPIDKKVPILLGDCALRYSADKKTYLITKI